MREQSPFALVDTLRGRIIALEAALPGMDLPALLRKDRRVLGADPGAVVRRLILLSRELGRPDLPTLVSVAPQLLYEEEVEEHLSHTIKSLGALLPADYSLARLQAVIAQAPTLIFRLDYYRGARTLADLPADIRETLMHERYCCSI